MKKFCFIILFLSVVTTGNGQDTTSIDRTMSFYAGAGFLNNVEHLGNSDLSFHIGAEYYLIENWCSLGIRFNSYRWEGTFTRTTEDGQILGTSSLTTTNKSYFAYFKFIGESALGPLDIYIAPGIAFLFPDRKYFNRDCPSLSTGLMYNFERIFGAEAGCTLHYYMDENRVMGYYFMGLLIHI